MNQRILLAGGGDERDSRPLDEIFAHWVGDAGRLLYLPVAMEGPRAVFDACRDWIEGVFRPLGVADITTWTDLREHSPGELDGFTALYLGGGNTYHLLNEVRATAFPEAIRHFVARGHPVYGGSAGAILLGRDIGTCAAMDENTVGLTDTRGLDLVRGYAVWCHYRPSDDPLIHAYYQAQQIPVLALPERGGARIEGEGLVACGYEPALRFDAGGKQVVEGQLQLRN